MAKKRNEKKMLTIKDSIGESKQTKQSSRDICERNSKRSKSIIHKSMNYLGNNLSKRSASVSKLSKSSSSETSSESSDTSSNQSVDSESEKKKSE